MITCGNHNALFLEGASYLRVASISEMLLRKVRENYGCEMADRIQTIFDECHSELMEGMYTDVKSRIPV